MHAQAVCFVDQDQRGGISDGAALSGIFLSHLMKGRLKGRRLRRLVAGFVAVSTVVVFVAQANGF
jgi:hypothetical protein